MEEKIRSIYSYIHEKPKRALAGGLLLYTAMFILFFSFTYLDVLLNTGSLLAGDGIGQFYPYALEFRRMIISFFDSFGNGSPSIPLISMNFSLGSDNWTSVIPDFLPFLPYYIFLPLIPESGVYIFWGMGSVLMLFLSGLAFFYMCRYFGKDPLISGFFAPFFTFCGNTFFTALPNQHLLYIYMSLPLLIVGIDKMIRRKGFALFPLTVCWLALSGIVQLFYTLPFVVIFAFIRVYFVYPDKYFRSLGICFLRCAGACILGLGMAAVILLPCISDYLNGARAAEQISIDIGSMLTPDVYYMRELLEPATRFHKMSTGILSAGIPFVIWMIAKVKGSREMKWYTAAMFLLVSLPIVHYGLNAFRYDLCRWGSVPGMLLSFLCVCAAEDIIHVFSVGNCKKQVIGTTVIMILYLALLAVKLQAAAIILLSAVLLFTMMPFAEKALAGAEKLICKILSRLNAPNSASRIIKLLIICIAGVGVIVYFIYVSSVEYIFPALEKAVLIFAVAIIATLILKKHMRIIAVAAAICLTVNALDNCYTLFCDNADFYYLTDFSDETVDLLKSVSGPENGDGSFGRIAYLEFDGKMMKDKDDPELNQNNDIIGDEETSDKESKKYNDSLVNVDAALRYDMFDSNVFKSVINGDLFDLHAKLGEDQMSLWSMVHITGWGAKEPLMSLLGIKELYDFSDFSNLYGMEKQYDGSDTPGGIYVYRNKYTLPAGATYSNITGKTRYDAFRTDDFAFAAMNEVYLEGEPMPENMSGSGVNYAKICDITHESSSRGTTSLGIECFDNTVHIKDDVSGCFLYITFKGVNDVTNKNFDAENFLVEIDNKMVANARIHNREASWPWKYVSDTYTISLGYHEDDVDKLEYVTPFEYTDFYVSAVPVSVYTSAYENVSAEKLENIVLSDNTLTGNITVSEDKALVINMLDLKGWRAYVDGQLVPIYKANGLFIGLPLTTGSHDIRLEYTTAYLPEGALITAASTAVFIAIFIIYRRFKKRSVRSSGNAERENDK